MKQQNSVLPTAIADAFALLPPAPHSVLLAAALNRVLGRSIQPKQLLLLQNKSVCVRVTDARLSFFLGADHRGFVARRFSQVPDLTIGACARDFLRLALRAEDPDTLFFGRRLYMEGDTELGLLIKNLLDSIDASQLFIMRWLPDSVRIKIRAGLLS
ncbi:MAG: ubiquinone anaerobic biosynthesis accessory factor UbiT [Sulfuriferula sp.]